MPTSVVFELLNGLSRESEGLRFDSARGILLSLCPTLVTRRKTSFPEVNLDTFNFFLILTFRYSDNQRAQDAINLTLFHWLLWLSEKVYP